MPTSGGPCVLQEPVLNEFLEFSHLVVNTRDKWWMAPGFCQKVRMEHNNEMASP
jgi:hypothetical protein